jgi:uncharacterized protein
MHSEEENKPLETPHEETPAQGESSEHPASEEAHKKPKIKEKDFEITLSVANDGLTATMIAFPPTGEKPHITYDGILKALTSKKITCGLNKDLLSEIAEKQLYSNSYIVAIGQTPVDGKDAQLIFHYSNRHKGQDRSVANIRCINLRELDLIVNVEPEELLLEKIPPTNGEPGITVTGRAIPQKRGQDIRIRAGHGAEGNEADTHFKSIIAGNVIFRNNQIRVENMYVVDDVNPSTGNIHFKGSVGVKGLVNDGYIIESGSDVQIGGSIGAANIVAHGDIVIKGGILGASRCRIESKSGSIFAKFAQNATLVAHQDIIIEEYTKECDMRAGKSIRLTSTNTLRGFILGGKTVAFDEVHVNNLGSEYELKTLISVGIDPETYQAMVDAENWLVVKQNELTEKVKVLHYLQKMQSKGALNMDKKDLLKRLIVDMGETRKAIPEMQRTFHQAAASIIGTVKGKVSVINSIFPGVIIRIGPETLEFRKSENAVAIKIGKDGVVKQPVSLQEETKEENQEKHPHE